ncbi:MAG TPA: MlaD family protein [Bacteroidota bacterium]|jgi:phospholipid/cholesterol/gamma-HCH transport system substrate-binding protein|nr:MlaD family protein [Bacteroidota bacterium]
MDSKQLKWSSLKVGIVVLIGLIIFVFIVSIVGTEQNVFTSNYRLKVFLPNVQGLVNGAMITLGGLKIGFVSEMQFAKHDSVNGVDVTMEITEKYRPTITTSSMGQIKTIGLLGDKYIDITIGSPGESPLAEDSYIPIVPSFDLEAAGPQFKKALADFTEVLGSVKGIVASMDKGEGSIGRLIKHPKIANDMEHLLASMNNVMTAIEKRQGALGKIVYDERVGKNIAEVSSNLQSVTDQIRQGKGTVGKLVMDDQLYANLSSFTSRADSLLGKASNDSSNVSRLLSDGKLYDQLMALMKDLNLLLVDLKQNPGRYIKVSVF